MPTNKILLHLAKFYDQALIKRLFESYSDLTELYRLQNWKAFGIECGHFVEYYRRILEQELFGRKINLKERLSHFNEVELSRLQNSNGVDEFRILVPRVLWSSYTLRNKRGIAHVSELVVNHLDANMLLSSIKWVLGELVRVKLGIKMQGCRLFLDDLSSKDFGIIWESNGTLRVLDNKYSASQQVMILLYSKGKKKDKELQDSIDYKNFSSFKKVLGKLHSQRLIEYKDTVCTISPKGKSNVEDILRN